MRVGPKELQADDWLTVDEMAGAAEKIQGTMGKPTRSIYRQGDCAAAVARGLRALGWSVGGRRRSSTTVGTA